ncbi:hypothetical protein CK215_30555 [Mesorhizobium sp. WSM3864]|uniref:hypothetical protein n=1 Tax=Mesorhizobium sp. WSM3864 TaxID=2029404 RepID=UPI000BB02FBE|nr:hypothetical protein [Mesorhizobium sp. WSM3864]PBB88914.1 hypothetical protein CK215_30555 [Mesorhizobium sp. WSM3864]
MLRAICLTLGLATVFVLGATTAHLQAAPNISVMSLPYVGWQVDIPFDDNGTGKIKIKPDTKGGRQIAAAAAFYSLEFCKKWYWELSGPARDYIARAKRSDPPEFTALQRSIRRAMHKLGLRQDFDTCVMLTDPYQAGGDLAVLMPWGKNGFYPEHDQ